MAVNITQIVITLLNVSQKWRKHADNSLVLNVYYVYFFIINYISYSNVYYLLFLMLYVYPGVCGKFCGLRCQNILLVRNLMIFVKSTSIGTIQKVLRTSNFTTPPPPLYAFEFTPSPLCMQ